MDKISINDIQLATYFLPTIEVEAFASHELNEETMTVFSTNARIDELEIERQYAVNIEVRSDLEKSTNPPYRFRIAGVAFFHISREEFDQDNAKEACYQVGHQLLFGAIREQLATLTSRGPWPTVQLRVVPAPKLEIGNEEVEQSKPETE